ncbi:hypothetical protein ACFL3D_05630 [Candidatus Omnitrophota bacterium]
MDNQTTNKRTLSDHAHYYFSESSSRDSDIKEQGQEMPNQSSSLTFQTVVSLGHCAIEGTDSLRSLVLLTPFYQKEFDQIFIITSAFNQNNALALLPNLGFEQTEGNSGYTFWNVQRSTAVSVIQENYLLDVLISVTKDLPECKEEKTTDARMSRLVLIDASGFGITFLDKLCSILQGVMIVSGKELGEAIESYQVVKAYSQLNKNLNFDYFFVTNTDDTIGPLVRDKVADLTERFLNKRIRMTSIFPSNFFTDSDINDVNVSTCLRNMPLLSEGIVGNQGVDQFFKKIEDYINGNAMIL